MIRWAIVSAPDGTAVAAFRDEGAARDWVACHYAIGRVRVASIMGALFAEATSGQGLQRNGTENEHAHD